MDAFGEPINAIFNCLINSWVVMRVPMVNIGTLPMQKNLFNSSTTVNCIASFGDNYSYIADPGEAYQTVFNLKMPIKYLSGGHNTGCVVYNDGNVGCIGNTARQWWKFTDRG